MSLFYDVNFNKFTFFTQCADTSKVYSCIPDDHYVQTLMVVMIFSLAFYKRRLKKSKREWCTSKGKPSTCFLFARKFTRTAALRLLNMTTNKVNEVAPQEDGQYLHSKIHDAPNGQPNYMNFMRKQRSLVNTLPLLIANFIPVYDSDIIKATRILSIA
ncbi:hypothetical protein RYX36_013515 [Vicia faba]